MQYTTCIYVVIFFSGMVVLDRQLKACDYYSSTQIYSIFNQFLALLFAHFYIKSFPERPSHVFVSG